MDNKLRDFGEEAVKNIQEQAGDDDRVPPLANKAGSCIQIVLVFLFTFFGVTYATYYTNQSGKAETYRPALCWIGNIFRPAHRGIPRPGSAMAHSQILHPLKTGRLFGLSRRRVGFVHG